jgi:hypothetical protein
MIQHLFAVYQRTATSPRRCSLGVTLLEERATPAAVQNLPPPILPPAIVQFVNVAPTPAPSAGEASVRSDLFGIGSTGATAHPNELEEMLTQEHAAKQEVPCEPTAHLQEKVLAEDGAAAVLVEDMAFLPQTE